MKRRKMLFSFFTTCFSGGVLSKYALAALVRARILIDLPEDRDTTGVLTLVDATGRKLAGPYSVYGRSDSSMAKKHGNPSRDPLKPYGNTPTGEYRVPLAFPVGDGTLYKASSYGPRAAFVLDPVGGDALQSKKNGRTGLLIHGGTLGAQGRLRATHGCLRMKNEDIDSLLAEIQKLMNNPVFLRCEVVQLAASIGGPGDPVAGEDVGDPPKGIEGLLQNGQADLPIVLPKP